MHALVAQMVLDRNKRQSKTEFTETSGQYQRTVIRKHKAHPRLPFLNYPNVKWRKVKQMSSSLERVDSASSN